MKAIYPSHDNYKPSGYDWVGDVPSHWAVEKLGSSLWAVSERNRPDLPLLSITREKGVIERDLDDEDSNHNFIPDDLSGYKVLRAGQFGMNKMKAWQGSYGVSQHTGIVSPAYFIFDFTKEIDPDFFNRAIRSKLYVSFFGSASDGVRIGQWDLNKSRMREIPLLVPPLSEQRAITAFLENKCAKIDESVKIKEDQITLLRERRQIIIKDAVTLGLNPTAPMKDSRIEWIGKIPSTWVVKRLQYVATCNDDTVDEIAKRNTDIKYVDISSVSSVHNTYSFEIQAFLDAPSRARRLVNAGDTIFSTVRPYLKAVATIQDPEPELVVSTGFAVARPRRGTDSTFLGYALRNDAFIAEVTANSVGASYPAINPSNLFKMKIPLPPHAEQLTIAKFLNEQCANIDETVKLKERQIDALKEYRNSLINAAVTGKIKVV